MVEGAQDSGIVRLPCSLIIRESAVAALAVPNRTNIVGVHAEARRTFAHGLLRSAGKPRINVQGRGSSTRVPGLTSALFPAWQPWVGARHTLEATNQHSLPALQVQGGHDGRQASRRSRISTAPRPDSSASVSLSTARPSRRPTAAPPLRCSVSRRLFPPTRSQNLSAPQSALPTRTRARDGDSYSIATGFRHSAAVDRQSPPCPRSDLPRRDVVDGLRRRWTVTTSRSWSWGSGQRLSYFSSVPRQPRLRIAFTNRVAGSRPGQPATTRRRAPQSVRSTP